MLQQAFKAKDNKVFELQPKNPLKILRFFEKAKRLFSENNLIICDVGDALFGSATLKLPKNSHFIGPAYYTSMGYAIPATIGVLMKSPELRPVVVVGDGVFR